MSVFNHLETLHLPYNMKYQRGQIYLLISSSFILKISLATGLHPKSIPGCCITGKIEKTMKNLVCGEELLTILILPRRFQLNFSAHPHDFHRQVPIAENYLMISAIKCNYTSFSSWILAIWNWNSLSFKYSALSYSPQRRT